MRLRIERALPLAFLLAIAVWAFRDPLRAARWHLQGEAELFLVPAQSAPASVPVPRAIAHAGGAWRGLTYTNSLEALDYNYARGARWFEMDFSKDAHGSWWAVHEWKDVQTGSPFQLATVDQVLGWFAGHPDTCLITDTKDDNPALLSRLASAPADLRSRIHPQIYRIPEYSRARSGGFGAPIFTTYRSRYPWSVLDRFARLHPLLALTVTLDQVPAASRALSGRVPLLTHTVNDPAEAARLRKAGIAGIYTDDLLP